MVLTRERKRSGASMMQLSACNRIQIWKRCMSLTKTLTNMRNLKQTHAVFVTHGLHVINHAVSKLLVFCALSASRNLRYASLLFNQVPAPNSYMYNTLIRAHSGSAEPHNAMCYFKMMLRETEFEPDRFSFHFAVLGCVNTRRINVGRQMHCFVYKNGVVEADAHVQTAVLRLYVDCEAIKDARKVFDEITERDLVQWNVMMNGCVKSGMGFEALRLFREMLVCGVEADRFCVATGIAACAHLGAIWQGKWIHEYVRKREGLRSDVVIGTALVDMYAKCGFIDLAVEAFEAMGRRNVVSWSAMIGAYGVHGCAEEAFSCLERMQVDEGIEPDGVVLLGVLTACNHAGLVEKGKELLETMEVRYGIKPKHEHYSCVIDLLCKGGLLSDAFELSRRMPMKLLASVWGALLRGCRIYNNVELAEIAVKKILQVANGDRGEEVGAYVQLSNIYLGARRSKDAVRIRKMIGDKGIKKTPGCSMLEVNGKVNEFVSGDVSHSHHVQICAMLDLISADSIQDL